ADGGLRVAQDATQPSTANGFVKAMFYYDPLRGAGQQIVTCFNSRLTGAAASTPPCGITFTHSIGENIFDFGFSVAGRVIQVTPWNCSTLAHTFCGALIFGPSGPQVTVATFYATGANEGEFTDSPVNVTVF